MTTSSNALDAPTPGKSLSGLLGQLERRVGLRMRVAVPGRVQLYDPTTQRADVTTELLTVVRGNTPQTRDVRTTLPPMVLPRVPVVWPAGAASSAYLSMPLVAGDTGLLVFADRSLERWKSTGTPDAPGDARAHSYADAVFVPGLHADPAAIAPPTDLTATVLEGPLVKLGRLATEPAVLGTQLQTALATFVATVSVANTTWGGNPATGAAFSTALAGALTALGTSLGSILSSKVLVQP